MRYNFKKFFISILCFLKILRIIRGYDEFNTILLPPRTAGEKLPLELYDYYEEQLKKLDEEEKKQRQSSIQEIQTESDGNLKFYQ